MRYRVSITLAAVLAALALVIGAAFTAPAASAAPAAPAAPAAAAASSQRAIPAVMRCNAHMENGGTIEMAVTLLADHGPTGDYQVALTNYAYRGVKILGDRIVDGLGRSFRGVTGSLAVGETKYFRANQVWQEGAIVQGTFLDGRGNYGRAGCSI